MKKLFLLLALMLTVSPLMAAEYAIDASHSTIGFNVKHMMVSNTTGQFNKYEGTLVYDPAALDASKVDITIDVNSIDTRNADRDAHLKSGDFFDATTFPTIKFVSKKFNTDSIVGDLTIKDVTKEVTIPVTFSGPVVTPFGSTVIGIVGTFTLNRQDYGVKWNKALDKGGLAVSDDVVVNISIEGGEKK